MKKVFVFLSILLLCVSCTEKGLFNDEYETDGEVPQVTDPIPINSPKPQASLANQLTFTKEQQAFAASSGDFALKCLGELYKESPSSMVFSPLSLQYALAMTVNGASGKTAEEITRTLGFGADLDALNAYCNLLLNRLPALDPDVEISLADALVVDKGYRLLPAYKNTVESVYYAPVEYMSFSDPKPVVDRINEWAYRNTNGLIFPLLKEEDLRGVVATLMNALYFKAPWAGPETMFLPELTMQGEEFHKENGGKTKVDLMPTTDYFGYAGLDGFRMVEIPYAGGRFAMYVLLPDKAGGLQKMLNRIQKDSWKELRESLSYKTKVHLRLPKFETASNFGLIPALKALGIRKAFDGSAEFDRMFDGKRSYIGNVMQKAKIKVTEWGTEAAAVTVVAMCGAFLPAVPPPETDFFIDHAFVYFIAERKTGTILFEGVYTGE